MRQGILTSILAISTWAGVALADDLPPPTFKIAPRTTVDVPGAPAQAPAPPALAAPAAGMPMAGIPSAGLPSAAATCGSGCFPGGCVDPCNSCCDRFYASAEYLMWWFKSEPLPSNLITTGNYPAANLPGAIGQQGTAQLIGGSASNFGMFSGMRYTVGYWFDPIWGVEVGGFLLEQRVANNTVQSNGNEVIAIPVTNAANGAANRFTVAEADLRSGSVNVASASRLWGTELNGLVNLYRDSNFRLTGIVGFRYLNLTESVAVTSASQALNNGKGDDNIIFNGTEFGPSSNTPNASNLVVDSFQTRNSFYGAQLGLRGMYDFGKWYTAMSVKVGLGDTHEVINNSGITYGFNLPAGTPNNPYPYGRLVGPSNTGSFSRDAFAVVPEVELKVGYKFGQHASAFIGYNFLYWSNVVRPGDQIDQTVDFRGSSTADHPKGIFMPGFTGTTAPGVPFNSSSFWAQGINLGLIFTY